MARLAREACQELFAANAIHLRHIDEPAAPPEPLLLCAVVAFSGPGVRGAVIVGLEDGVLRASRPRLDAMPRDWLGELANQLVGRMKHQLRRYRLELFVTAPAVLRGEHLPVARRDGRLQVSLVAPAGRVRVWLDAQFSSAFTMLDRPEPGTAGPGEGESLLF